MKTQKRHIIRNQKIISLAEKENMSTRAIAPMFNLTKERVRQIIGKTLSLDLRKSMKEKRINDAFIKAETLAQKLKRLPQYRELKDIGIKTDDRVIVRARLLQLGFKGGQKYSKEYLTDHLRKLAEKLGRTPGSHDVGRNGPLSAYIFCRYFGSMRKAQKAAGLVPNKSGQTFGKTRRHDDEFMLEHLRQIAKELGRTPYGKEINAQWKVDSSTYFRHFGSMKKAYKKAELPQPENIRRFLKKQRLAAQK